MRSMSCLSSSCHNNKEIPSIHILLNNGQDLLFEKDRKDRQEGMIYERKG